MKLALRLLSKISTFTLFFLVIRAANAQYVLGFPNTTYPDVAGSGYALDYTPTGPYVQFPNSSTFKPTNQLTVEAWVKSEANADQKIVSAFASPSNKGYMMGIVDNHIYFEVGTSTNLYQLTVGDVPQNQWVHLAMTFLRNGDFVAYVNGEVTHSKVVANQNIDYTGVNNLTIGAASWNPTFFTSYSTIDEVRIWGAVLSKAEIRKHMCQKINASHPKILLLRHYFRFDDGNNSTVADLKGGIIGTVFNSPTVVNSGAPLGDTCVFVNGSNPNLTYSDGNHSLNISNNGIYDPNVLHYIYHVTDTSVVSTFPPSVSQANFEKGYFGLFSNVALPTEYKITYNYASNTSINKPGKGYYRLVSKPDGGGTSWTRVSPVFSNDSVANTIKMYSTQQGEFVPATFSDPYPNRVSSGNALNLSGSNKYALKNWDPIYNKIVDEFTVEAWVNPNSTANQKLVSISGGSTGFNLGLIDNHPYFEVNTNSGNISLTSGSVPPGRWTHIAMTFKRNGTVKSYINGRFIQAAVTPNFPLYLDQGERFVIGGAAWDPAGVFTYTGQIDEVRLWTRELTESELIQYVCQKINTSHPKLEQLFAYYKFDDNLPTTLLNDRAGNIDMPLFNINNVDFVTSGAPLGDQSIVANGASGVVTWIDTKQSVEFKATSSINPSSYLYAYKVLSNPNSSAVSLDLASGNFSDGYIGFYYSEPEDKTFKVNYNYFNRPELDIANENLVRIVSRNNPGQTNWYDQSGDLRTDGINNKMYGTIRNQGEVAPGISTVSPMAQNGGGKAMKFSNTGEYASSYGIDHFNRQQFTAEVWVKPAEKGVYSTILSTEGASGSGLVGWGFRQRIDDMFGISIGENLSSTMIEAPTGTLVPNKWAHLAFSYNYGVVTFYINGEEVAFQNLGAVVITSNEPLTFGQLPDGDEPFKGEIDEFRMYGKILSVDEIRSHFCNRTQISTPNMPELLSYFNFDEVNSGKTYDLASGFSASVSYANPLIKSTAYVGDTSVADYSNNVFSFTPDNNIGTFDIEPTGTATGAVAYWVKSPATSSALPSKFDSVASGGYLGILKLGPADGTYSLKYKYSGGSINSYMPKKNIYLLKRSNSNSTHWIRTHNNTLNDTVNKEILLTGNTGTEYVVGFGNPTYPKRPGSGHTLTFFNSPRYLTNTTVHMPDDQNGDKYTIEAWFRLAELSADYTILSFANQGTSGNLSAAKLWVKGSTKKVFFEIVNEDGTGALSLTSADLVETDKWYHVAVVCNTGTSYQIYLNGLPTASTGAVGFSQPTLRDLFTVGADYDNGSSAFFNYFKGNIDEVRLYNKEISLTDIRNHMCKKVNPSHPNYLNLYAYWRFDEGDGNTIEDLVLGHSLTPIGFSLPNDWIFSGAPLGDTSVYRYPSASFAFNSPIGNLEVTNLSTSTNFIHAYFVNDTSNRHSNPITNYDSLTSNGYFGIFVPSTPILTYDLGYSYSGNTQINGVPNESEARFVRRQQNNILWSVTPSSVNTGSKLLITSSSLGRTEISPAFRQDFKLLSISKETNKISLNSQDTIIFKFNQNVDPAAITTDDNVLIHTSMRSRHPFTYEVRNDSLLLFPTKFLTGETVSITISNYVKSTSGITLSNPSVFTARVKVSNPTDAYFSTPVTIASPTGKPQKLWTANLNNDNLPDIIGFTDVAGSLYYMLSAAPAVFSTSNITGAGIGKAAAFDDYNKDGFTDMVYVTNTTVMKIKNNGGTSMTPDGSMVTGFTLLTDIVAADFNADSYQDFIFCDNSASKIYLHYGTLTGIGPLIYTWSSTEGAVNPNSLAVADVNNDGLPDLLFSSTSDNQVKCIFNSASGLNTNAVTVLNPVNNPYNISAGDFNNDGYPDLIVRSDAGSNSNLFLNDQAGSFGSLAIPLATGLGNVGTGSQVFAADINGDSNLDAISMSIPVNDNVYRNLGTGTGTVGSAIKLHTHANNRPVSGAFADLDGDGDLDFVASINTTSFSYYLNSNTPFDYLGATPFYNSENIAADTVIKVRFRRGIDQTTDANHVTLWGSMRGRYTGTVSFPYDSVLVFNPDSLFFPGEKLSFTISNTLLSDIGQTLTNPKVVQFTAAAPKPAGIFKDPISLSVGLFTPKGVATGDFNNDGKLDLIYTESSANRVVTRLGYGNGNFEPDVEVATVNGVGNIVAADLDADGFLDAITFSATDKTIGWLKGDGSGAFSPYSVLDATSQVPTRISVSAINADAYPDITVLYGNNMQIEVLVSNGPASYTVKSVDNVVSQPSGVDYADFSNDGRPYIYATYRAGGALRTFRQSVAFAGDYTLYTNTTPGTSLTSISTFNYDNDGLVDVIISTNTNTCTIYRNSGGNSFAFSGTLPNGGFVYAVDLTGNGKRDALIRNGAKKLLFHRLSGIFSLTPDTIINTAINLGDLTTGDFDNDGDIDIVFTDSTVGTMIYIENTDKATRLSSLSLNTTSICHNDTLSVGFSANGPFDAGNKFYYELSQPNGSFIASKYFTSDSTTNATLPIVDTLTTSISPSTMYLVKVHSTSPQLSAVFPTNLSVNSLPNIINPSTDTIVKAGEALVYKSDANYDWYATGVNGSQLVAINTDTMFTSVIPKATPDSVWVVDALGCKAFRKITVNPSYRVGVKVWLEGNYNPTTDAHNGGLASSNLLLPFTVFASNPFTVGYSGLPMLPKHKSRVSESILGDTLVDVVKIELLDAGFAIVGSGYGWVMNDGTVRDYETATKPFVVVNGPTLADGNYYVKVKHRNHLAIMSATMLPFSIGTPPSIDFGNLINIFGGGAIKVDNTPLRFGMIGGDYNHDGEINANDMYKVKLDELNLIGGYQGTDATLDGDVNSADYNKISINNDNLYFSTAP